MDLQGRHVTVMGLGHFGGGVGAARYLVRCGARVTVTDLQPADKLADSIKALDGLPITWKLGGHDENDFRQADLIVVNPAVPKTAPLLEVARRAGVPLTSELNLFIQACPAPIIAVTGTAGKSTTSALLHLALSTRYRTHFGGNIGRSLLADLDQIRPDDRVLLEISSFQLQDAAALRWSPTIAVLTNLSPNHLDHHGTMADYAAAKQNILRFQQSGDVAILPAHDAEISQWAALTRATVAWYDPRLPPAAASSSRCHGLAEGQAMKASSSSAVKAPGMPGDASSSAASSSSSSSRCHGLAEGQAMKAVSSHQPPTTDPRPPHGLAEGQAMNASSRGPSLSAWRDADRLCICHEGQTESVLLADALQLPGEHNVANLMAAALAARAAGVPLADTARATRDFTGLPHRLQLSAEVRGVRFYNDSKATTPTASQVALQAFDPARTVAIAGGYDKKIDLSPLVEALVRGARTVLLIGATAEQLDRLLAAAGHRHVETVGTLQRAIARAADLTRPGDVVLLSPGHASWDQFENYEKRGEEFRRLALMLTAAAETSSAG